MGLWNFIVDAGQDGHLNRHDEELEKLKEDMETARLWIEHLNREIEELKNERNRISRGNGN
jgi:FtsZ-binding cell division protein ZapB